MVCRNNTGLFTQARTPVSLLRALWSALWVDQGALWVN